jgi:hypothetical protein
MGEIEDFAVAGQFAAPTLVLSGARSDYVAPADHALFQRLFPARASPRWSAPATGCTPTTRRASCTSWSNSCHERRARHRPLRRPAGAALPRACRCW